MHSSKNRILPQSFCSLSVIVPILNEAALLPQLFANMQQQCGIDFEVIVIDGGSTDQSLNLLSQLAATVPFPVRVLSSPPGRGRQMNAGVALASGCYLLFLHADSVFLQRDAWNTGLEYLRAAERSPTGAAVAARFTLAFAPELEIPRCWRTFHSTKARMNRRGCIHGDQGFLLSRVFYTQVGPFDGALPFLEDDRLSDKIFAYGRWILLPVEIITSPRRYIDEGFWRRDALNMLILALYQSGYGTWLSGLTATYRAASAPDKIRIMPALNDIRKEIKSLSCREELRFWLAIARCIRDNLWQLRLLLIHQKRRGAGTKGEKEVKRIR